MWDESLHEEIDHKYTEEIVCPYCGHEHQDSWERRGTDLNAEDEDQCESCEKTFKWYRGFSVWYNTAKVDNKGG